MEKWKKIYGKCKIRARNVRFEDVLVLFNHFGIRLAKEKRTKKGSHYLFSHPIVEKYEQKDCYQDLMEERKATFILKILRILLLILN